MKASKYLTLFNKREYWRRVKSVYGSTAVAYTPMLEPSGAVAVDRSGNSHDGAYTGVELANAAAPGGGKAPLFDGTNDFMDMYSAGFIGAVDMQEFKLGIWAKVYNSGVWTDGAGRRILTLRAASSTNEVQIFHSANNQIRFQYAAGGTNRTVDVNSLSSTGWMLYELSASKTDNEVKAFINGVQVGSTQTVGTWVGAILSDRCVIGAVRSTPGNPYYGWLSHFVIGNNPSLDTSSLAIL